MLRSSSYIAQLRQLRPLLIRLFALVSVVLAFIVFLRLAFGVDVGELTRDPIHKTGLHPFVGFLSNLGVLLWSVASAVCVFTAVILRRSGAPREKVMFFLLGGLITAWLMLDDLFLFHDVIFREYLGLREFITYPLYAVIVGFFLYRFRATVRDTDYLLLFVALGAFALSMLVDMAIDRGLATGAYLIEDGFKFIGIVTWMVYLSRAAFVEAMSHAGIRKSRMTDGVCPRCHSTRVVIESADVPIDVPELPLAAVHRYEKPFVERLRNRHLALKCDECGYSEVYVSERTKLVSVTENRRRAV